MTAGPISLSFEGLVTNDLTGEQTLARWRYRQREGDASASLDIWDNGRPTRYLLGAIKGVTMRTLQQTYFGGTPGGHAERVAEIMNDPVNIDRTRRNALQDRIARRSAEMESPAAD